MCPVLTAYAYYYFALVDYDGTLKQIYFTSVIGITSTFYILVMFTEVWLLSTLVYAPLLVFYLFKTSQSLGEFNTTEFTVRCLFTIFVYASVAYKVEILAKQSFLGKESYEKSFNRWLKIFETFPEGIAMVRNDDNVMYANSSLKKLLDLEGYDEAKQPKSDG